MRHRRNYHNVDPSKVGPKDGYLGNPSITGPLKWLLVLGFWFGVIGLASLDARVGILILLFVVIVSAKKVWMNPQPAC